MVPLAGSMCFQRVDALSAPGPCWRAYSSGSDNSCHNASHNGHTLGPAVPLDLAVVAHQHGTATTLDQAVLAASSHRSLEAAGKPACQKRARR